MPTLTAIYVYPVKSCRGMAVTTAQLDRWGLQYDRNWLVVDDTGRFISQREAPTLALVEISFTSETLCLRAPGQSELHLPLAHVPGETIEVTIWRDRCQAVDQGEEAAAWFSHYLGQSCRVVRMGASFVRTVNPAYDDQGAQVTFADGYPLLLIAEASLAHLNAKLDTPLPMNRFRPNLVVADCAPHDEDQWKSIQINGIPLDLVKPCDRCIITTTDQDTALRAAEPLKTLATYRRASGGLLFGQNVIHRRQGLLTIGSPVDILAARV